MLTLRSPRSAGITRVVVAPDRPWTPVRLIIAAAFATLLSTSCINADVGEKHADVSPPPPEVSQRLVLTAEPPARPPSVRVAGISLEPLSYEWFDTTTGEMSILYPDERVLGELATVKFDSTTRVDIDSTVVPLRFDVQQYREVDGKGMPTGAPATTECRVNGSSCEISIAATGVESTFKLEAGASFVTISLSYALVSDFERASQQGYAEDYASYGFYVNGG